MERRLLLIARLLRQVASGRALRDFLDDPHVTIRVLEGNVGVVALTLGIRAADARLRGERRAMEDLGRFDTARNNMFMSCNDERLSGLQKCLRIGLDFLLRRRLNIGVKEIRRVS
jgi:hypothetical protein